MQLCITQMTYLEHEDEENQKAVSGDILDKHCDRERC